MGFTFFETIMLTTCFFLSVAAILTIFRAQRTCLSLEDMTMLRMMIRREVAEQQEDGETQRPYEV